MRIFRSFLTVSGFTAVSRVFGLIREICVSYFLGASPVTDAFFVAFKFPNFFRRIFAEGAFNAAFVPYLSRKLVSDGRDQARLFAEQVFAVMLLILTVFVILVVIFTPSIIHLMTPGFTTTPERLELAITFTRITFPYILFISLAAHLSGVLNSFDRFAAAAGVPIILNIIMVGSLLLAPDLGIPYGTSLSLAVFVAGIAQFAWLYAACWRMGFPIHLRWPRLTPDVRQVMRLMIPGAIGAGVMNINFFIDIMIASYLPEKSISYIFYADRLNQLPLSIFGIAIGVALLPTLSRQLRGGEPEKAYNNKLLATEFSLQLTIPAAIGLFILSEPLISLIYRNLSPMDVHATANALAAFALGVPAYVLNKVFVTGFFARQDTKTPVKVACACIIVNLASCLCLIPFFSHVALALAISISAWMNTLALYIILKRKGWFFLTGALSKKLVVVTLNAAVMGGILWQLNRSFQSFPPSLLMNILHIIVALVVGITIIVLLGMIMKTLNLRQFRESLTKNG